MEIYVRIMLYTQTRLLICCNSGQHHMRASHAQTLQQPRHWLADPCQGKTLWHSSPRDGRRADGKELAWGGLQGHRSGTRPSWGNRTGQPTALVFFFTARMRGITSSASFHSNRPSRPPNPPPKQTHGQTSDEEPGDRFPLAPLGKAPHPHPLVSTKVALSKVALALCP